MNTDFSARPPRCGGLDDDLKAFLDDELTPQERQNVVVHLENCPICREEIQVMQNLSKTLQSDEKSAPNPYSPALRAKILDETTPVKPAKTKKNFYFVEYAALAGVVGLVLIATLTLSGGRIKATFSAATNAMSDGGPSEDRWDSNAGAVGGNAELPVAPPVIERRVHKEGQLTVAVTDVEAQTNAVITLVKGAGGWIASNSLSTGGDGLKTANLELKIPTKRFDDLVSQIGKLGEVRAKNLSGRDITEGFATTQARGAELTRILSIREAQAKAVTEKSKHKIDPNLLAEVRRLRVEAAQTRAQLEVLRQMGDLADLSLSLQGKSVAAAPVGFLDSLGNTSRQAWASFLGAAQLPINAAVWILAYSPFWLPGLWMWRKFGHRVLE